MPPRLYLKNHSSNLEAIHVMKLKEVIKIARVSRKTGSSGPPSSSVNMRAPYNTCDFTRVIRYRMRVVGAFSDGNSALVLGTVRLMYMAESKWGSLPLPGCHPAEGVAVPKDGPRELLESAKDSSR